MKHKVICHVIGTLAVGGGTTHVNSLLNISDKKMLVISLTGKGILKKLIKIFFFTNVDILHIHGPRPLVVLLPFLAYSKFFGLQIFFTPHGYNPDINKSFLSRFRNIVTRLAVYWLVDKFIFVGEAEKSRLQKFFKVKRSSVIYNGVYEVAEKKVKLRVGSVHQIKKIVLVGRFDPVKNYSLLLKIAIKNPDLQFYVIGDGIEFDKIEKSILEKDIQNIFLLGWRVPESFDYSEYDAFLSLSLSEGLPYTVIEAISHGLWPILSNISPHREIIEIFKVGHLLTDENQREGNLLKGFSIQTNEINLDKRFTYGHMLNEYRLLYDET